MKLFKNAVDTIKSFYLDEGRTTWTMPNGNIVQPRFYKTFSGYGDNYIGNMYSDEHGARRFGAQLGRFVFTTEPK